MSTDNNDITSEKVYPKYQEYVNDFKNCFSIYKTSMVHLYEKLGKASTGNQRDYYN